MRQGTGEEVMAIEAAVSPNRPSLSMQTAWLLTAKVVGFAVSFIVPILIARILNQREFGLYKQVFLTVTTAIPLISLGFHANVFYFLPRMPAVGGKIVFNVLIVNLTVGLASLIVLLVYPQILQRLFGNGDLISYAPMIGLILATWMFSYFIEMVATAHQDVKYSTAFIVLSQLTRALTMGGAALIFRTLESVLYAALFHGFIQTGVLLWYLQKRFPLFWTEFDSGLLREQARYSVPLGLSGIAATIQNNLHMFFVANRFSAAEFAVYSVGCVQLPLTSLLWESVNAVLLPRISELQRQGKDREIAILLSSAMRKLGFVHLPIFWLFTIIGYDFLTFLYTTRYAGSWPIFLVNLVFIPISLLIVDPVLRAYAGQVPFLVKSRIVSTMLMVPAVVVGIRFGMPGVLAAVAVLILAERLVLMYRITRVLRMNRHDIRLFAAVGKLALASFIAAAVTALARQMLPGMHTLAVLVIAAAVFCSVYVAAVFLLCIATAGETEMIRSKLIHVGRVLKLA